MLRKWSLDKIYTGSNLLFKYSSSFDWLLTLDVVI